jgi:hypothetical protein
MKSTVPPRAFSATVLIRNLTINPSRPESKSLFEKGARLCRRPAAARRESSSAPNFWGLLRLVEDDTAALRGFQTSSKIMIKRMIEEGTE